ncbi:MAG: oxygen-independent coproporphyrinogen III oxidase [Spirochaetia bacterium]|nr:oxygen-independent coproporphyrinogen III oxidase [Spirochaetia bacterium]
MTDNSLELDNLSIAKLIEKYNTPVPRYTSYPTALEWSTDFDETQFFAALKNLKDDKPMSVYIHVPFCENRCLFCGCNVLVSKKREIANVYLDYLLDEIRQKVEHLSFKPRISQLHFGGGTPNYLTIDQWERLVSVIKELFILEDDIEWSIELDPMMLSESYLDKLKETGVNRVSFGIQDVNEKTQQAVNRPQKLDHINSLVDYCRKLNFDSVNIDLIYGLPYQTLDSYQENIKWITEYKPDRIALFSYAHIPWIKHHQKRMPLEALTTAEEKLRIYLGVQKALKKNSYKQIGMDHFALPDDPMSLAQKDHSLHRNFMGYTTKADLPMLAFGASAISEVSGIFTQNHNKLKAYKSSISEKRDYFEKGLTRSEDDTRRSEVIQSIMNNFYLNFKEYEKKWNLNFVERYKNELLKMKQFEEEQLVTFNETELYVTEKGKYVLRHIASAFDVYRKAGEQKGFSKGI